VVVDATFSVPKLTLAALSVNVGVDAPRLIVALFDVPAVFAVNVAVCAALTAEVVAEKLALVAPRSAIMTEAGTATAAELLDKPTDCPPVGAAAFSVTVQLSVAAPVSEALAQLRLLSTACPVPFSAMVELVPVEELLVRVTVPLAAPDAVGSKPIISVAVWPALRVNGKVAPESVNPVPLIDPALTVTEAVPDEVRVTD